MEKIRIGIIGIGNCASSLMQGISYFNINGKDGIGLMNRDIGGYSPSDIQVVAAFDIDKRKIGRDVAEAIFSKPNCTTIFFKDVSSTGVKVRMGKTLDGFSDHMKNYPSQNTFLPANEKRTLKKRHCWRIQKVRDRNRFKLSSRRLRKSHSILCGMCLGSRGGFYQQYSRFYRQ